MESRDGLLTTQKSLYYTFIYKSARPDANFVSDIDGNRPFYILLAPIIPLNNGTLFNRLDASTEK